MFNVIEIVGKRGRTVPVLLTTEVMAWLNALVAKGHDLRVHREYYQLPVARYCPEGYKLSRLFLSLERGNLGFPTWKSLDELHVTGGKCTSI